MSDPSSPLRRLVKAILPSRLVRAARDPSLTLNSLRWRLLNHFGAREFVGVSAARSDSDAGTYVAFVRSALEDRRVFAKFRRHPSYTHVLEHVTKEQGRRYLSAIESQSPELLNSMEEFQENDLVGDPFTHTYAKIGRISPTTLRYVKVASDLRRYFGESLGEKIVEIGGGYGGQLLILDRVFNFREYHMYDLAPVLGLVSRYLESYILKGSYTTSTLNQCSGDDHFDLVISNYAFSELPSQLQLMYIEKILSKCAKGYITMNSGLGDSIRDHEKLSLADLRGLLPPFETVEENPRTSPSNYLLIWGHVGDP